MPEVHDGETIKLLNEYAKEFGRTSLTVKELVEYHKKSVKQLITCQRQYRELYNKIEKDKLRAASRYMRSLNEAERKAFHRGQLQQVKDKLKNLTLSKLFPEMFGD